ncbi:pilus assembly protein CpaE [Frigoribacterium sp. 2-23]|uniref:pilus assembly protein CpaE n=1 Tax=Frigoribacterium sp. 2-23 TaxID=3415006 RepID=UPI003C6EF7DB
MIDVALARRLRESGLRWKPAAGDRFVIERGDFDSVDVFTVSDMTVEAHEYPTGTVLGFNGTTEWALDSVEADDALWLPRENQLRDLLGRSFRSLTRSPGGAGYEVGTGLGPDDPVAIFTADDPEDAYAAALLAFIEASLA